MKRLSDTAIAIINELHAERLDYQSEYLPLIDAAMRLSSYEDTYLEPEEYKASADAIRKLDIQHIHDLLVAEQDGRLVVLPCKVGNTVYQSDGVRVYESKVKSIWFDTGLIAFDERAIGTSVFLTRAEAEAALEAQKGERHETDPV